MLLRSVTLRRGWDEKGRCEGVKQKSPPLCSEVGIFYALGVILRNLLEVLSMIFVLFLGCYVDDFRAQMLIISGFHYFTSPSICSSCAGPHECNQCDGL
jgi:hypothetical protein